jgi:ribonucleoside-diphosphate reductase alpha chain
MEISNHNLIKRKKFKMYGPQLPISEEIHSEKYRTGGEDFREAVGRIANALKDNDEHYDKLRDILLDMRFMPAGRIQSAMGSGKSVTPYNCFVSGTIEDSFVEGEGSIMQRATEAATTMRMGGGIGYDFSTLRPRGALIKKLESQSSGPISFMEIYDAICRCVASSGHRRGAQMGVLRVDHPDIIEFIHAKQNQTSLTGFNISIAITDSFMEAVKDGSDFPLVFEGQEYRRVDARDLWEMIMRSTWDWAEPGVIFIDRVNEMNNLKYCETIVATNPCGEQPLPPNGACLLGSFNLVKYIRTHDTIGNYFAWTEFVEDIPAVVRAMDNVIDRATYPLPEQEKEAKSKRRMGLGVTGLANAAEAMGYEYGSTLFLEFEEEVLSELAYRCYMASIELAQEKGAFPLFDRTEYIKSEYLKVIDEGDELTRLISSYGIRNSHLISIAPTGTISLCADNVSSGIEPVFSHEYTRTIQTIDGPRKELVQDYGYRVFKVRGKTADKVTADEHVAVLNMASKYSDSAVSKTCNVSPDMPWEEFKAIYFKAWAGGAKGCTTFNSGGKRFGVLVASNEDEEGSACFIDSETGRRECS